MKTLWLVAALLSGLTLNAAESTPAPAKPPTFPPPLPAAMKHWQDARFGMFIHWGPVSLTEQEISNLNNQMAQAQGLIAQGLIQIYRAMGGGWETRGACMPPCPDPYC